MRELMRKLLMRKLLAAAIAAASVMFGAPAIAQPLGIGSNPQGTLVYTLADLCGGSRPPSILPRGASGPSAPARPRSRQLGRLGTALYERRLHRSPASRDPERARMDLPLPRAEPREREW